jgi:hypothetical protein
MIVWVLVLYSQLSGAAFTTIGPYPTNAACNKAIKSIHWRAWDNMNFACIPRSKTKMD